MDHRKLAASLAASLLVASSAMAASNREASPTHISSEFATWAGGAQNAQALVNGLHSGSSITLATNGPDRGVSLAGFTPAAPLGYDEIRSALTTARSDLAHLGSRSPSAEQIQAALIGGEVQVKGGRTRALAGSIAVQGGNPNLAAR
jgi:hypothetical protein